MKQQQISIKYMSIISILKLHMHAKFQLWFLFSEVLMAE